jgi:DNA-directed RNA polymerase specialized sigma24 family protein
MNKRAADDAVQTTLLRSVEHLDTLREPERIGAWLVTTLRPRT